MKTLPQTQKIMTVEEICRSAKEHGIEIGTSFMVQGADPVLSREVITQEVVFNHKNSQNLRLRHKWRSLFGDFFHSKFLSSQNASIHLHFQKWSLLAFSDNARDGKWCFDTLILESNLFGMPLRNPLEPICERRYIVDGRYAVYLGAHEKGTMPYHHLMEERKT